MSAYGTVPQVLKDLPNWIVWKAEKRNGKQTKVPYNAKTPGEYAKSNDPSTWTTFDDALKVANDLGSDYDGCGFMLFGTDLVGVDFDGVMHEGAAEAFVLDILEKLGNPYSEITPSGNGLRTFVRCAKLPEGQRKFSGNKYGAEIYSGSEGGRYLTCTGNHFSGQGVPTIEDISVAYFMVTQIRNEKLKKLWMGDISDYDNDNSRADLALLGMLSRLLNKETALMEKYFGASKLGQRAKWTDREDYRKRTIKAALAGKTVREVEPEYGDGDESAVEKNRDKLDMVPLSHIEAEIQEWLWENRIPKSALTNLSGDADKGKSLVLYDILSRISNGKDFPDGAKNPYNGEPKKVLLLFAEGSLKTTVKPRMMVMGANMDNVITLKSVSHKGEKDEVKRQFYLETDLDLLREALRRDPSIVAVGFDPITNYLGDDCNMNRSQEVRRVLTPLCDLAEECGVTIISILHFSKNTAMNAIHRTGGAAALVEVPRAAWCCMDDDDPENTGGFVFVRIKNNLGKRVGGLRFRIEETFIPIHGVRTSQPALVWGTKTEKTADDLLNLQNNPEMKGVSKARNWLEETFKDGNARKSTTVFAAALAVGISEDCLKKARQSLRMESKKLEWVWYMRKHQGESEPWQPSTDLEEKMRMTDATENSAAEAVEVF